MASAIQAHLHRVERSHLPWSASTIRDVGFIAIGLPLSLIAPAILASSTLLLRHKVRASLFGGNQFLTATIGILVPVCLVLALIPWLSRAQRWRFSSFRKMDIGHLPPPVVEDATAHRILAFLGQGATWRQLAYHLIVGPLLEIVGLTMVGLFGLGMALSTVVVWISAIGGSHPALAQIGLTLAGFLLLLLAPRGIGVVCGFDGDAGTALLGPNRGDRLLATMTESRSELVAAADTERRRIERDLHDGAQARLVSLAMNLGLARATRTDFSHDAKQLIAEAHDEAISVIDELRHLVRGLHPAILDDLGLDAALSGLAARVPLPVSLHVAVEDRASPTVEAVAYFVVSEALTNIVKHADATRADIAVERIGDSLRVMVFDDGNGGADATRGSGIRGLLQRVRSVDGAFQMHSPPGGPTTIVVELPCGS